MSEVAIRVEKLGKRFFIGGAQEKHNTLRDAVSAAVAAPFRRAAALLRGHATGAAELHEVIWAFRDLHFQVDRGEVVGIVGRNGAGKTTLLKVLSQITEPSEGFAEIHGRVGSLLEVGTGFHPELTGRENVYLNGAILGMRRADITAKFDEIVEFAEIGKFVDTPVKHYSSGMYVRLAFGVAAHLEPEILIVDEVLSVGDAAFQRKCLGKMGEVAHSGRTVLFVSHNMAAVTQLCSRAILLEDGGLGLDGPPHEVVGAYLARGIESTAEWTAPPPEDADADLIFISVRVLSPAGKPTPIVSFDQPFRVELQFRVQRQIQGGSVASQMVDSQGIVVWTTESLDEPEIKGRLGLAPGVYTATCEIPAALLRPGRYFINVGAHVPRVRTLAGHERVLAFDVSEVGFSMDMSRAGVVAPRLTWVVDPHPTHASGPASVEAPVEPRV